MKRPTGDNVGHTHEQAHKTRKRPAWPMVPYGKPKTDDDRLAREQIKDLVCPKCERADQISLRVRPPNYGSGHFEARCDRCEEHIRFVSVTIPRERIGQEEEQAPKKRKKRKPKTFEELFPTYGNDTLCCWSDFGDVTIQSRCPEMTDRIKKSLRDLRLIRWGEHGPYLRIFATGATLKSARRSVEKLIGARK